MIYAYLTPNKLLDLHYQSQRTIRLSLAYQLFDKYRNDRCHTHGEKHYFATEISDVDDDLYYGKGNPTGYMTCIKCGHVDSI